MSTIGDLLMPEFRPFDYGQTLLDANRIAGGRISNQTNLLALEDLRRQQEAQQLARQYYQANPQALLGEEPQSTLGSPFAPQPSGGPPGGALTQQAFTPGQPPGPAQVVPGGQDLSRFAMAGGPPAPGATGQAQSTLASLGPQGQAHPLMALMRTNPDAAFAVLQREQQQQAQRLRFEEQRLTMGTKVAEYVGRVAQGVRDQASLDQARQELQRIHPQAAAQLPQVYSKEAMTPFVTKAVDVATNAKLRLATWQNQIEEQKLGVQLAQAGYQGLGTDVTGVLRGLTPEQVQQFGGRTTPAAIAYATEQEKQRKLAQAGEAERLKFEQEQKLSATLPLQDARKEDAGLFVYKGTGQTVPGTMPYGQTKQLQDEKDPDKGVVKLANLDEKKQLTTLKQLEPVLQQYADLVQYAYGEDPKTGKKGPMADYQRGPFQTIGAMWNQLAQDDPVFQAKRRALQGQLQSVVRGLGARGDLNAQELEAAQQMLANMDASLGLGLSLGPMVGTGGIGVGGSIKPSISLPDTPETGINIANELIGTVNRRIGSILQHEGYARTPYIRIRTDQEAEAKPGEMPRATPRPAQGPLEAYRPPRALPYPLPGEGPPAPLPPAPTVRPAPPTATSTPQQDEAYRQSVAPRPAPAPVPSAPAPRPTPGRQSQASPAAGQTRVARASTFKVMNQSDVVEAMRQTGRSRREVEAAARARGYAVYGSKLPLPGETAIG